MKKVNNYEKRSLSRYRSLFRCVSVPRSRRSASDSSRITKMSHENNETSKIDPLNINASPIQIPLQVPASHSTSKEVSKEVNIESKLIIKYKVTFQELLSSQKADTNNALEADEEKVINYNSHHFSRVPFRKYKVALMPQEYEVIFAETNIDQFDKNDATRLEKKEKILAMQKEIAELQLQIEESQKNLSFLDQHKREIKQKLSTLRTIFRIRKKTLVDMSSLKDDMEKVLNDLSSIHPAQFLSALNQSSILKGDNKYSQLIRTEERILFLYEAIQLFINKNNIELDNNKKALQELKKNYKRIDVDKERLIEEITSKICNIINQNISHPRITVDFLIEGHGAFRKRGIIFNAHKEVFKRRNVDSTDLAQVVDMVAYKIKQRYTNINTEITFVICHFASVKVLDSETNFRDSSRNISLNTASLKESEYSETCYGKTTLNLRNIDITRASEGVCLIFGEHSIILNSQKSNNRILTTCL